ncbi:MAG: transposase [Anaerolineae bacterium]|nr:transposase [Anaerolineae bacterium]MDQ7036330.1 transposase [Anaerolineae bacterium]
MPDNKQHNRRSTRLPDYDYRSNGAYFITICVEQKQCLLGHVDNGDMILNNWGEIAKEEWLRSFEIRKEIKRDEYIIMPNHFHAIVWIERDEKVLSYTPTDNTLSRKPKSLSTLVSGFKGAVTRKINLMRDTPSEKFWQRNYYERIIRKNDDLHKIRYYIKTNPETWGKDSLYTSE